LLARLCKEQGKTVVMIGHDVNLAQHAASHALLLMGDGRWTAGSVAEVLHAPLLSQYLGHPIEAIQHGTRQIFIPEEACT
jgi:iron complex transport system ATP-binding protein